MGVRPAASSAAAKAVASARSEVLIVSRALAETVGLTTYSRWSGRSREDQWVGTIGRPRSRR
ncbi:hypothetical protein ACFQE7_15415 [Nonomuraea ferruginea]|uniref:hypothetical protein n=1 Tax=Nonomuraea ferruginea TaxID=46174 RepID=UPI003616A357